MKKACFVIMPFGGSSPELKRKFDGVYKGIIVPAIQDAGYEAIREDISATPGSIPKSIVKKLAEADMVIADLTGMNPNVFYELGIRHVLSKCGTVLIINKGETIPFDNASHRVIQYTNELADLDDIHKQIVSAIVNRENNAENSDNIVHDTFPQIPTDIISTLAHDSQNKKMQELQQDISKLTQENKQLKEILTSHGILKSSTHLRTKRSVKEIFSEARFALQKSGHEVILQLHQFASNNEVDKFTNCLEDAIEAGYLSESDYIQIKDLCETVGYLPLELAVMERAADLFPESDAVIRNLSDIYTRMPLPETKHKGISMIEELLAIKEQDGIYAFTGPNRYINRLNLGALFNAYSRLDFYNRTVSVCESYESLNLPPLPMVTRNKASAYGELGQIDKARQTYKQLLDEDYYDDTHHAFYSSFLADIGEYVESYKEHEIAAMLDLYDPNRFMNLAIEILNHHYVRISEESIEKISDQKELFLFVMPLFAYALEISDTKARRIRIAEILMHRNQHSYADMILNSKIDINSGIFHLFPLEYILKTDIETIKSVAK